MQITLLNGLVVSLKWNWLVVEKIEEVVGGDIENLTAKGLKERGQTRTVGDMVYAVIQANLNDEYERNELLSLVEMEDIERILEFISKNEEKSAQTAGKKK